MTNDVPKPENADIADAVLATIRLWQNDTTADMSCPACEASGLVIFDRSARPHAEWYIVRCKQCGLNETIHIPVTAHVAPIGLFPTR